MLFAAEHHEVGTHHGHTVQSRGEDHSHADQGKGFHGTFHQQFGADKTKRAGKTNTG